MHEDVRPFSTPATTSQELPQARFQLKIEHVVPVLLVVGVAAYWLWRTSRITAIAFPLDDAWIHAQFARNLASGEGFSFNPGIPSSGSTAPLWSLLLTIPVAAGLAPVPAALALGILLTCATVVAVSELTRILTNSRIAGVYAGCCVALSGRVTWASVSGMEGPLFAFLTVAALLAYVLAVANPRRSQGLWGLAAGLAGTARPEAFILFPVLALHWMIGPGAAERRERAMALKPLAWFGTVAAAYVALNLYAGGHLLPMTFYAKSGSKGLWTAVTAFDVGALLAIGTEPLVALNKLALFFIGHSALFFAALIVGLLALTDVLRHSSPLRSGASVVAAVLLLSPLLKGLLAPEPSILTHLGRYITHLTVLYLIAATVGFVTLHRFSRRRWVVPLVALLALARLGAQDVRDASVNARWTKNINDLQVVTGRWIADHTSPDAVVATNDIGAVAYFSRRFIVDTEGLITPEAIPFKRQGVLTPFLEQARPDLVVIFPEWYPEAVGSPLLQEIHRFSAPRVIAGGSTLVAYRLPWTRPGTVESTMARQTSTVSERPWPTETERRVLEALWIRGPGTVAQIQNAVSTNHPMDYATVLQALDALVAKRLVIEDGRSSVYSPRTPGSAQP